MLLVRIGFVVYWAALSLLLLVPDPHEATGLGPMPPPLDEHLTHFFLLSGLAFLAHASRWPLGSRVLIAALLVYAVAIEALQGLVPPRGVEAKDFAENVLGILAGSALWWVTQKTGLLGRHR